MAKPSEPAAQPLPPIAIAAGAAGLALTIGLIGFIGWEAVQGGGDQVAAVVVEAGRSHRVPGGYLVEFTARNRTARSAANVEIEAELTVPGAQPIVSTVALDYVPARSQHRGGILLPADPRAGRLELRALGYIEP